MQVIHPQTTINNVPPENMFIALDEMGTQVGTGYIIYQYQEHLFPDCPINMYFSIDSQVSGQYLIFGALIARARQLRDANPNVHACVYTGIRPDDTFSREFYLHNGMRCEDTENIYRLAMPATDGRVPMGCSVDQTPLNTPADQLAFLRRLQDNDITFIDQGYLLQLMRQPHFQALGLFNGNALVGEIMVAGSGDTCELEAIYIMPGYRHRGMARALLSHSMTVMAAEGVSSFTTRFMSRSKPQQGLARAFQAADLGASMLFPGLYL